MADDLLIKYAHLFTAQAPAGPILDLAAGSCRNGIFLASKGLGVVCCDISGAALESAKRTAHAQGVDIAVQQTDLESEAGNFLPEDFYAGIIVFRYLHRPLIPFIRKALKPAGILIYETFTGAQPRFGRPHNPRYLLKPAELLNWFADWEVIHYFEGVVENPQRAVGQIVCRKRVPAANKTSTR